MNTNWLKILEQHHNAIVALATIIGFPIAISTIYLGFEEAKVDRKQFRMQFELAQKQFKFAAEARYIKSLYEVTCAKTDETSTCVPIATHRERSAAALAYVKSIGTNDAPEGFYTGWSNLQYKPNLSEARLENTNLNESQIPYANFVGANFSSATLNYADLRGVLFTDAIFTNASVVDSNLTDSSLRDANLSNAYFRLSTFENAKMAGVVARETRFDDANMKAIDAVGADFTSANFGDAYMAHSNLSGANFSNARLVLADLSGANMSKVILVNANLELANIKNVRGLTCIQLVTAKNWEKSFRDNDLSCGKNIPNHKQNNS